MNANWFLFRVLHSTVEPGSWGDTPRVRLPQSELRGGVLKAGPLVPREFLMPRRRLMGADLLCVSLAALRPKEIEAAAIVGAGVRERPAAVSFPRTGRAGDAAGSIAKRQDDPSAAFSGQVQTFFHFPRFRP